MFDPQSDYALNKVNTSAIVCKSVTGIHTELTREDFSSEAEFQRWKIWSDEDYHSTEQAGRHDDSCIPLDQSRDAAGLSLEDELIAAQDQASADAEQRKAIQEKIAAVRKVLTATQYRRLWMYCVDKLSITDISILEHVTQQRISQSLLAAYKRIVNIL